MIYEIKNNKTALLIIDAQKEYSNEERPLFTSDFKETIEKINIISNACRKSGIPVFLVKHVHDSKGRDVGRMGDFSSDEVFVQDGEFTEFDASLDVDDVDIIITKTRYSAFVNTNIESYLKSLNIDTLLITGFMEGYCSVTTARHAHDLDYKVIFVSDANSGPVFGDLGFGEVSAEDIKRVIATLLSGGVAEVINTEETIKRMKNI